MSARYPASSLEWLNETAFLTLVSGHRFCEFHRNVRADWPQRAAYAQRKRVGGLLGPGGNVEHGARQLPLQLRGRAGTQQHQDRRRKLQPR